MLLPIHHFGHLHAGLQLIGLGLDGEDTDLAGFEIVEDRFGAC